jgi:hypothetical protein
VGAYKGIAARHNFTDIAGHDTRTIAKEPDIDFFKFAYRILHEGGWMNNGTIDMYINTLRANYSVAGKDDDIHIGFGLRFLTSHPGSENMGVGMDHTITRKKVIQQNSRSLSCQYVGKSLGDADHLPEGKAHCHV